MKANGRYGGNGQETGTRDGPASGGLAVELGRQLGRPLIRGQAAGRHLPGSRLALVAMAKRFVADACSKVAGEALQMRGGYGYLADHGVEKIVRGLRVHRILEGPNEIMRLIIARGLFEKAR